MFANYYLILYSCTQLHVFNIHTLNQPLFISVAKSHTKNLPLKPSQVQQKKKKKRHGSEGEAMYENTHLKSHVVWGGTNCSSHDNDFMTHCNKCGIIKLVCISSNIYTYIYIFKHVSHESFFVCTRKCIWCCTYLLILHIHI